jgi:ribosomal protein L35AE/L33A
MPLNKDNQPTKPRDRTAHIDRLLQIVKQGAPTQIEAARDDVSRTDLGALAAAYQALPTWEQKCHLVNLVQDTLDPRTREIMRDVLHAPDDADGDYVQLTKAIAVCHLERDLSRFMTYYEDRQLLAQTVRRYLHTDDRSMGQRNQDMQEMRELVKKGSAKLNRFFYVGLVVGLVMGILPLVASFIPAAREAVGVGAEDVTLMRIFGGGMTFLLGVAIVEQWVKHRRDTRVLSSLDDAGQIVWVYKEISTGKVQRRAGEQGATVARFIHVYFHMLDGSHALVWLSNAEADRLVALAARNYPHVTCGYSEEIERAYKQDPAALQAHPRRVDGVRRRSGGVRIDT